MIEGDYSHIHHRDLGIDVFTHRKTWRWLHTRLWTLLAADTPTGRLYTNQHPTPGTNPAAARSMTPEGVGTWLAGLAK